MIVEPRGRIPLPEGWMTAEEPQPEPVVPEDRLLLGLYRGCLPPTAASEDHDESVVPTGGEVSLRLLSASAMLCWWVMS